MLKVSYKMTTQSSLIVSQRSGKAFYAELENDEGVFSNIDAKFQQLKVIYPFYQYGEYATYAPQEANYYLPGSSIKGTICMTGSEENLKSAPLSLMVDDVPIPNDFIVLRNLYRAQSITDPRKANFDVFFENVGVEMVSAGSEFYGELFTHDKERLEEQLKKANRSTRFKIKQMLKYLRRLQATNPTKDFLEALNQIIASLSGLEECENVLLLGGYKGLLHSLQFDAFPDDNDLGAIFIDQGTKLPHGLIEFELEVFHSL